MADARARADLRPSIELFYFAYRAFTSRPDRILAQRGLGRVHHRILYFVGRNPGLTFDHRKLVVADGRVAFDGGRNFRTDAFREAHDLSYTVAGPLVADVARAFEDAWRGPARKSN